LSGSPLKAFLGSHPPHLRFVQTPKPFPASFAQESYFGVSALKFINAAGEGRFGRYRITPEAGNTYLDESAVRRALFDQRAQAPGSVVPPLDCVARPQARRTARE
jgi:catalase